MGGKKNRKSFTSHTFEDLHVKVLEGTMPAFRNRDRKYIG
jgi:hypothetical protein